MPSLVFCNDQTGGGGGDDKGAFLRKKDRKKERKVDLRKNERKTEGRTEEGKGMANTNPGPQAAFAVPRGLVWQTKPVLVFRGDLDEGFAGDTLRSYVSYVWMMREAT
jgi:hypothetical protein